ncbi:MULTISPECIES: DUF6612 family protein [unclassified Bacillus cereus group]|uniref:DUF6612 family protein n=1 Tax=unclassified Bacillus cereus group TaxID=2750818 RepID=UPI001F564267|nr:MULTISPECIES: DUF6612 family protein [unclassified Bacillus cereus group]
MKKIMIASSLLLTIGLGVGCSSDKVSKTDGPKTASVKKEKELAAKDVFNKAYENLKNEEYVTLMQNMDIKADEQELSIVKAKIQIEPKTKSSRAEMNVSGTDIIIYGVKDHIVGQVKNPNTGEVISIPEEKLNISGMNAAKSVKENVEIPPEIVQKMKIEKSGDKYKLKLRLKGKDAESILGSIGETQKKALEAQNAKVEEIDAEYMITKDFKYESLRLDIVVSRNSKEKAHFMTDIKYTSYEKFDPIQLPATN